MTERAVRRRMKAEDRREQILDIAHAVIDREGFHAATPNRIAADAGITRPVLYQQFGDVGGLYVALIDREADRAAAQFARGMQELAGTPPAELFVAAFEVALRALDSAPATWRLFLFPPQGAPPVLHQRLAESEAAVRAFLEQALIAAVPGLADPEYTARVVHAGGRELLRLRLTEPERATDQRLLDLITHLAAQIDSRAAH